MSAYKVDVTREDVVTVVDRELNDFGDLVFTDSEGAEHKLGKKRESMFNQIVVGRAVKLSYAEYMNKEYIAIAKLFDGQSSKPPVKPVSKPETKQAPAEEVFPNEPKVSKPMATGTVANGQRTGMLTKEIGDMIRAGKLVEVFGDPHALALQNWYVDQVLDGTVRVK